MNGREPGHALQLGGRANSVSGRSRQIFASPDRPGTTRTRSTALDAVTVLLALADELE